MDWKDIGEIVGKAAPVIGTLFGGPAGPAIGALVASAIGTKPNPQDIAAAVGANPELLVRLKELETNSSVQLQQLAVTAEQNRLAAETSGYAAEVADRDSARKFAQADPHDSKIREYVTYGLLAGAFAIVGVVLSGVGGSVLKDATVNLLIGTIIGYWFNELKQVLAFWFGATREATKQQQKIADFAISPGSVTNDQSDK